MVYFKDLNKIDMFWHNCFFDRKYLENVNEPFLWHATIIRGAKFSSKNSFFPTNLYFCNKLSFKQHPLLLHSVADRLFCDVCKK